MAGLMFKQYSGLICMLNKYIPCIECKIKLYIPEEILYKIMTA